MLQLGILSTKKETMMRYTLDQLKGMSGERLYDVWKTATFPFDMARCGNCLTQHKSGWAWCTKHNGLIDAISKLGTWTGHESFVAYLQKNVEELYALRLFYDNLYPSGVPMLPPVTVTVEAPEPVLEPVSVS